jgi:hypothetical protein
VRFVQRRLSWPTIRQCAFELPKTGARASRRLIRLRPSGALPDLHLDSLADVQTGCSGSEMIAAPSQVVVNETPANKR